MMNILKRPLSNKPYRYCLVILSSITLLSCAKISTVSTNLDRENFKHYFAPTKVAIVESEADFEGKFRFIGLVEGQSCQEKPHHDAPNEIDARTDARRNAFEKNANAVIFSRCVLIEQDKAARHCVATKVCYARAYQAEQTTHD
jgi:RcsF protein